MIEKRLDWLDVAKGFGILLVIFAHTDNSILRSLIYTFHVPLFFFLSGYVFSNKYDFKTFLIKKIKAIVVPYFLYGIPMIICQIFYFKSSGSMSPNSIMHLVKDFLVQNRMWTLWFIACLFWLNILFYWVERLCKTYIKIGLAVTILLLCGICYYHFGGSSLPWNVDICFMMIPFFFVGYVGKNYYDAIRGWINTVPKSVALFIVCLAINQGLGLLSLRISGSAVDIFYNKYGILPLTYISAFAGIIGMIIFSHWFIIRPIKYIGRHSMIYFAWHQHIFLTLVIDIFNLIGFTFNEAWPFLYRLGYNLLVDFIIVILITLCSFIIEAVKKKITH